MRKALLIPDRTGREQTRASRSPGGCSVAVLLALLAGCDGIKLPQWGSPAERVPLPQTQPAGGPADQSTPLSSLNVRPVVVQTINFNFLRVRATAGTFSKSEKLWNPVNEDSLPVDVQLLLRNNGLRVGVAKESSWPQIKAALEAEKVEVSQDSQTLQNGIPLSIELNAQPRDQTLFLIRSDGTMPGAAFPQSTNALRIEYWIPPNDPKSVIVELIPEIRLQRPTGQDNLAMALGNPAVLPPSRPLRELAARMRIGPDEFLVLGPSMVAQQPHLIGAMLLAEEIDGRKMESMCYITPKIITAGQGLSP